MTSHQTKPAASGGRSDFSFAESIRRRMARRSWTQVELSRRSGVPQGTISNFLAGRPLRTDRLERLYLALRKSDH